ncbi:TlyA family RNA methyltransferase [Brevibacterium sp.]|uniref:TlyA family RNA methyltransferase n=1 Tax=Brevibacterium sp. TaxID=1701 RepID=UPI0025BD6EA9|nr:TlyA family RNA methyltransferase [Brevibacterium sp.]
MAPSADDPAPAVSEVCAPAAGRLDVALVEAGLASSRNRAAREIRAGRVQVDGRGALRAADRVAAGARLRLEAPDPWVARSAHKLLGALADSGLRSAPDGAVCLDAGASTGGFTQVLLSHGAAAVHAADVGHGQLVPLLAQDHRVRDLPGTNVRELTPAQLAAPAPFHADGTVDLVVADLSFISLTLVLDGLLAVCRPGALLGLMVKPQFELGRSALDKHGVVADPADRVRAVLGVVRALGAAGAQPLAVSPSRLPGPAGNREVFVWARARTGPAAATPATTRSASVEPEPGRSFVLASDPRAAVAAAVEGRA